MRIELEVEKSTMKNDKKKQRNKQRKFKTEHKILNQDQINILANLKRQLLESEKKQNGKNGKQKTDE